MRKSIKRRGKGISVFLHVPLVLVNGIGRQNGLKGREKNKFVLEPNKFKGKRAWLLPGCPDRH
jgi:hypothetical protein